MKKNMIWKIGASILGMACLLSGAIFGAGNSVSASADVAENRYFHAENATVSTEWVNATGWFGNVPALKTTLAIDEDASYAKAIYNGVVNPAQTVTICAPAVKDETDTKITAGSAVALTYSAVSDPTKQLKILSAYNATNNFVNVYVAFTDDFDVF